MIEFKEINGANILVYKDGEPICNIDSISGNWAIEDFFDAVYTKTTAADLRQIADKLDELNGVSDEGR